MPLGTVDAASLHRFSLRYGRLMLVVGLIFLCLAPACRRTENRVVVRILLPPGYSPLIEAITKLAESPLAMEKNRTIVPAWAPTQNQGDYQRLLGLGVSQVVVFATADEIPIGLRRERRYTTLPCSSAPSACVAVLIPSASTDERRAADILFRQLGPRP